MIIAAVIVTVAALLLMGAVALFAIQMAREAHDYVNEERAILLDAIMAKSGAAAAGNFGNLMNIKGRIQNSRPDPDLVSVPSGPPFEGLSG